MKQKIINLALCLFCFGAFASPSPSLYFTMSSTVTNCRGIPTNYIPPLKWTECATNIGATLRTEFVTNMVEQFYFNSCNPEIPKWEQRVIFEKDANAKKCVYTITKKETLIVEWNGQTMSQSSESVVVQNVKFFRKQDQWTPDN